MLRIGPARNTPARGIAAILSCVGVVMCMFGGFMVFVGIILTATADNSLLDDEAFSSSFFDDSRRRRENSAKLVLYLNFSSSRHSLLQSSLAKNDIEKSTRSHGFVVYLRYLKCSKAYVEGPYVGGLGEGQLLID